MCKSDTDCSEKPTEVTLSSLTVGATLSLKLPSAAELVPDFKPLAYMLALATGLPASSTTFPETDFVCAVEHVQRSQECESRLYGQLQIARP